MRKRLIALTVVLSGTALCAPIQWSTNGHTYEFITDVGVKWSDARDAAALAGGYLVTITSSAEQAFIVTTFAEPGWYHIGLNEVGIEGNWVWITGEASAYTNWVPGEPNNCCGGESFGAANGFSGQWNDIQDLNWPGYTGYIVERDNVPEPGSAILLGCGLAAVLLVRRCTT